MSWANQYGALGPQMQRQKVLGGEEADLRRYKMAEGLPYEEQSTDEANPYYNMNRKSFQHEQDIGQAASELPNVIQQAVEESGGNIEILKGKLQALKDSSYPSLPSPEHTPRLFWNYVQYLQRTQGPEEASRRVAEYMQNAMINKVKGSLVPSL